MEGEGGTGLTMRSFLRRLTSSPEKNKKNLGLSFGLEHLHGLCFCSVLCVSATAKKAFENVLATKKMRSKGIHIFTDFPVKYIK